MFFTKYENKVFKEFEKKLESDCSINNIINVFADSYSNENAKYKRSEDADMLLFQYGVYDWGEGKNLEIDFVRQIIKKDSVNQIHITLKFPYKEKFSRIESYSEWYNSYNNDKTLKEWKNEIENLAIFQETKGMEYKLEIWSENAE